MARVFDYPFDCWVTSVTERLYELIKARIQTEGRYRHWYKSGVPNVCFKNGKMAVLNDYAFDFNLCFSIANSGFTFKHRLGWYFSPSSGGYSFNLTDNSDIGRLCFAIFDGRDNKLICQYFADYFCFVRSQEAEDSSLHRMVVHFIDSYTGWMRVAYAIQVIFEDKILPNSSWSYFNHYLYMRLDELGINPENMVNNNIYYLNTKKKKYREVLEEAYQALEPRL